MAPVVRLYSSYSGPKVAVMTRSSMRAFHEEADPKHQHGNDAADLAANHGGADQGQNQSRSKWDGAPSDTGPSGRVGVPP